MFAARARREERSDVEAHAVVDVRLPSYRLLVQRLPAHEDVVWRLARNDFGELVAEMLGRGKAIFSRRVVRDDAAEITDPLAEIGVAQLLQHAAAFAIRGAEPVIVHQGGEAALRAIPDVPDERGLVEQSAMALEEAVGEPAFQILRPAFAFEAGAHDALAPCVTPGGHEHGPQAFMRWRLSVDGGQADDAVLIDHAGAVDGSGSAMAGQSMNDEPVWRGQR